MKDFVIPVDEVDQLLDVCLKNRDNVIYADLLRTKGLEKYESDTIHDTLMTIYRDNRHLLNPTGNPADGVFMVNTDRLKLFLDNGGYSKVQQEYHEASLAEIEAQELDAQSKRATITAADAAVKSAEEAKRSSDAAIRSARLAFWALIVAAAAFILSLCLAFRK